MTRTIFTLVLFSFFVCGFAQNEDSLQIKKIFSSALSHSEGYNILKTLTTDYPGRLCGSDNAEKAVNWMKGKLENMGFDTVFLQETKVIHWVRGEKEIFSVSSEKMGKFDANICALGGSVATEKNGFKGKIIEVKSFEELKSLGEEKIKGKIVFYNVPMDNTEYNTFMAYGKAAGFRVHGAVEAVKYGASGVITRSLTTLIDEYPHTGIMRYDENLTKIPCAAISTADAEKLSLWLQQDNNLDVFFKMNCQYMDEVISHNVIAEIKGSTKPEEIITIGGHLDSWDIAPGAQDDGAGCIHAIETMRIINEIGLKPTHTIRTVLFMDEEFGQRGGKSYAENVKNKKEKVIAAIESDAGSFTPIGYSMDAPDAVYEKISGWKSLFQPYGLDQVIKGWGGVDIHPLKEQGIPTIGLMFDSQRYFDYQHAASDNINAINRRELQLGCASMATLVYLIDKYGTGL